MSWNWLLLLHAANHQNQVKKAELVQVSTDLLWTVMFKLGALINFNFVSFHPHPLSFGRSNNSPSGSCSFPVGVLSSHPRNTWLRSLRPPSDNSSQEHYPHISSWTKHPWHYGHAPHAADCKGKSQPVHCLMQHVSLITVNTDSSSSNRKKVSRGKQTPPLQPL